MIDLHESQLVTERKYSKQEIAKYVQLDLKNTPELVVAIENCVGLLEEYLSTEYSYKSKNVRVGELDIDTVEALVYKVLEVTMLLSRSLTFTALVGMCCNGIHEEKLDSIKSISEIIAYMDRAGLLMVIPASESESEMMEVLPVYIASEEVSDFARNTRYLPPMVCKPNILKTNRTSPYLTITGKSLILKSGNHHDGEISLDNLNRLSAIPLSLDLEMLKTFDEEAAYPLDTPKKVAQFKKIQTDSYEVFLDLVACGNKFFQPWKSDKRGRSYADGYHCNVHGNSFRKSIINFAKKEIINGVP